jgi:hypothetical protein
MLLFAIILLGVIVISGVVVFWMELSITNDRLRWLEERLTILEKDAVKITFSEPTPFHPKPKTQSDYVREHKDEFETKIIDDIKSRGLYTENKTNPKVLGEWQTKNGDPFKKSNPKQFDGFKSEEPFVKTRTKRKPTTVSDWEDKFDLGGHE